jgi:16S rRNA (uracil1498-N3)-methyltransferase
MQLFYEPDFDSSSKHIAINPDESRHMVKVLRKALGAKVYITNGKGLCAEGSLISNHPKKCNVEVHSFLEEKPKPFRIHLAIAPTKSNDRIEWFLEKATEIGVDEVTLLLCEHSERKHVKVNRYEKVLQAAMKQSLKFTLPRLNQLTAFKDFINSDVDANKMIAHCADGNKEKLSQMVSKNNLILIGPEGDFSKTEIDLALQNNYTAVSLSESRLRTETAGIVACHTLNLINSL